MLSAISLGFYIWFSKVICAFWWVIFLKHEAVWGLGQLRANIVKLLSLSSPQCQGRVAPLAPSGLWLVSALSPALWLVRCGCKWLLVTHHLLTHNLCPITVYLQIVLGTGLPQDFDHRGDPESEFLATGKRCLFAVFNIVLNRKRATPRSSNKSQPTLTSAFCLLTVYWLFFFHLSFATFRMVQTCICDCDGYILSVWFLLISPITTH